MTTAERRATGAAFGACREPPTNLVGAFVVGGLDARRQLVKAEPQFRAYHELELPPGFDPDRAAFGTVYQYPQAEYVAHVRQHGSPKGYAGPAACCRVPFDMDRTGNLEAALADARKLVAFLRERYGEDAERGLSVAFSGSKGLHVTLTSVPGFDPTPRTPAVVKALALAVSRAAGVRIDSTIYHHQALIRLPNTRHPKTGLYKRFFDLDDLDRVSVAGIRDAAKHPAGYPVTFPDGDGEQLARDWQEAERAVKSDKAPSPTGPGRARPAGTPVVPDYVRRFIAFGDIQDPGRAVTLFRCAAALAESGTPPEVVFGLLEEVALKIGLEQLEVDRQIRTGIEHGIRCRKEVCT